MNACCLYSHGNRPLLTRGCSSCSDGAVRHVGCQWEVVGRCWLGASYHGDGPKQSAIFFDDSRLLTGSLSPFSVVWWHWYYEIRCYRMVVLLAFVKYIYHFVPQIMLLEWKPEGYRHSLFFIYNISVRCSLEMDINPVYFFLLAWSCGTAAKRVWCEIIVEDVLLMHIII